MILDAFRYFEKLQRSALRRVEQSFWVKDKT